MDKPTAVGAHIYAGGFTVGVSKHFEVLAHLEHAAYGSEVVKLNYPDMPVYAGGPDNWPTEWPKGKRRPRFFFANPPCACWSNASHGRSYGWRDDPRLQFHKDIFAYATTVVQPDIMAVESVPPSWAKGREYFDEVAAKAADLGYSTTVAMHNSMWLGVAQKRSRIFYVYHKVDIDWDHPEFAPPKTVRQALKGVKVSKGGFDLTLHPSLQKLAPHTPPGGNFRRVFDDLNPNPEVTPRGTVRGRPAFLDVRAPWDEPAPVLVGGHMAHPDQPRYLAKEELAAICGYPPDYKWPPQNYGETSSWMSRGIMPPVGAWLAENVLRALQKNKRLNNTSTCVLDLRKAPGAYYEV